LERSGSKTHNSETITHKAKYKLDIKDIEARLNALELPVAQLVNGYTRSTKQYSESLASLKTLATHVANAALRASNAAQLDC
jgi:hypothetical protein